MTVFGFIECSHSKESKEVFPATVEHDAMPVGPNVWYEIGKREGIGGGGLEQAVCVLGQ